MGERIESGEATMGLLGGFMESFKNFVYNVKSRSDGMMVNQKMEVLESMMPKH